MLEFARVPLKRLIPLEGNSKRHNTSTTTASINQHGFRDPMQVDLVFLEPEHIDLPLDDILANDKIKLTLVLGHDRTNALKAAFKKDKNSPPDGVELLLKNDKVVDWLVPVTVARSSSKAAAVAWSVDHNLTTIKGMGLDESVELMMFDQNLLASQINTAINENEPIASFSTELADILLMLNEGDQHQQGGETDYQAGQVFDEDETEREYKEVVGDEEPEPPEDFAEYDENIDTEHTCPKCGYQWSGGK